jgi:hypothetical protein
MSAPKAFISYSREGGGHDDWVLTLAADLRRNGVDASLDQWDLIPGQDTTLFMESQIRDSDFVVLVCTPLYCEKSNIPRGGVGYEKNIISAEMLQAQGLNPKFIPLLRRGEFATALPTYLGSKYGIDFRDSRDRGEALNELLRAIHQAPPATKPPLGENPFLTAAPLAQLPPRELHSRPAVPVLGAPSLEVAGDVDVWEKIALGRFEFLRTSRISKTKIDPFGKGFWQGSFVLQGTLRDVGLAHFLEILRGSKTGRTGWDIGWVPTREGIAPYPFKNGIEVWLAEDGGKGAGHSDFWRAELVGRFSLFRGYQEDESDFKKRFGDVDLDVSLVIWRIAEFLLYLERFAERLGVPPVQGVVKVHWTGLEGRRLGYHKAALPLDRHICRDSSIESRILINDTAKIKKTLVKDVHRITRPLFESFDFFELKADQVERYLNGLFDASTEGK